MLIYVDLRAPPFAITVVRNMEVGDTRSKEMDSHRDCARQEVHVHRSGRCYHIQNGA